MKKLMMLGVMIAVFGLGTAAALAAGSDAPPSPPGQSGTDEVCPGGDSGKIDVSGNHASLTVTAPEGELISGYCVKAGSANQGLGPEFHTVSPAAKTVTITHSSGKDISHYSLTFDTAPTETTPTETTPTETTPTETTPTETTPTETTPTETTPTETTPTETTPTETTPTETTSTQEEQPVSTPPASQDPAEAQPTVVAGVKATVTRPSQAPQAVDTGTSATRPTTAPQAAPFTP